jgi:hypothetical protein
MSLPLKESKSMIYGDTYTYRYQLLAGGNRVSDDLNAQTITLTIVSDNPDFETIAKDIVTEGWVVDNTNKYIKVVVNTETYLMTTGIYTATLVWEDQDRTLIIFDIYINPAPI